MLINQVFRRTEVKYLLSPEEYERFLAIVKPNLKKDKYFRGTNCSVYFDNDEKYIAIHSLEKPLYKEKVRVRSYGVPGENDTVFIEIKKKFSGVGSKRRIPVRTKDFQRYLETGELLTNTIEDDQIKKELDYCWDFYQLKPVVYIAYDREAYCDENNPNFRVTFDQNIRYRTKDLELTKGDRGIKYFQDGSVIMEVKALGGFPLYFVRALSRLKIYPTKFSKYNKVMNVLINKEKSYV
ncbi:MAG: polyphosphate polymerase domain-containing protein [Candidatus Saccharibacteria bacterium]|nr:polyphosphate polymerase domain-containing protein [Candidatus Saccharibacteria bacterium]